MNKKVISIVAIIALVAILGVCLVACNADSYAKKLEGKGYTVETMSGEELDAYTEELGVDFDIKWGVGGQKGTDMVAIYAFENADDAESFGALLNLGASYLGYEAEVKGKLVYFGTEQGVKDAK